MIIRPATIKDAIFQHSVLCQTFLPYRNPGDEINSWVQTQGRVSLGIQATQILNKDGKFEFVGLPYGIKARLILAHINSQAIKAGDKTLDVEKSMSAFIKSMGLTPDTRTMTEVKEQLRRITTSMISLGYTDGDRTMQVNFQIVKAFDTYFPKEGNKRLAWTSTIQLTDDYFNSLMTHAIPLDERALQALSHNAMALDVYAWLAQRLHRVQDSSFVSWQNLKDQFGQGYKDMFKFKEIFRKTLQIVRTQYPTAKLTEDSNKGFYLYPSPTPIPQKPIFLK